MTAGTRIGIDPGVDRVLVARVTGSENGADDAVVESLTQGSASELPLDAEVTVAVPDGEVAVKQVHLPAAGGIDQLSRVTFELAQTVLEPPDQFQFEALPTSNHDRMIGLIYRRERLRALEGRLFNGRDPVPRCRFLMRAVALGRGYRQFAEHDSEGLLCLVDLANRSVSLCFLHDKGIVAVSHMVMNDIDRESERTIRAFGVNLKSLINYQLAGCAQNGLAVPLSTVVMCGGMTGQSLFDAVAPLFTARVVAPRPRAAGVTFGVADSSVAFPDCLAALGLTVN